MVTISVSAEQFSDKPLHPHYMILTSHSSPSSYLYNRLTFICLQVRTYRSTLIV